MDSNEVAKEKAAAMLGNVLVTKQTGEVGREVRTVYFTEAVDIAKEFYLAILMDRATSKPVVIASLEGGVDIEEVAENSPEKIIKVIIAIYFESFSVFNILSNVNFAFEGPCIDFPMHSFHFSGENFCIVHQSAFLRG